MVFIILSQLFSSLVSRLKFEFSFWKWDYPSVTQFYSVWVVVGANLGNESCELGISRLRSLISLLLHRLFSEFLIRVVNTKPFLVRNSFDDVHASFASTPKIVAILRNFKVKLDKFTSGIFASKICILTWKLYSKLKWKSVELHSQFHTNLHLTLIFLVSYHSFTSKTLALEDQLFQTFSWGRVETVSGRFSNIRHTTAVL